MQSIGNEALAHSAQIPDRVIIVHDRHFRPAEVRKKLVHYIAEIYAMRLGRGMRVWFDIDDNENVCNVV